MQVLAWSFASLARGVFPEQRHDGLEWQEEDRWRKRRGGGGELVLGAVVEVKGDWKQLSFCFDVPTWTRRQDKPICCLCTAARGSLQTEHGVTSAWLQPANRLSHYDALPRLLEDHGPYRQFGVYPGCRQKHFKLIGCTVPIKASPQFSWGGGGV